MNWMFAVLFILVVVIVAMFVAGRGSSDNQDTKSPTRGNAGKASPGGGLTGGNDPTAPRAKPKTSEKEETGAWSGIHSPEEEYMVMARGDKEKTLFDHGDGYGNLWTKERRDVEAPEPCGFDFKNVIVNTNDGVDLETGEMGDNPPFITPDLNNFAKIANDWKDLKFFWEAIEKQVPRFPMSKVLFYINNLKFLPTRKTEIFDNNVFQDHDYTAYLVVEPLTKTGKVKKFPVRTLVDVSWHEPFDDWYGKKDQPGRESIRLSSYYLKDGRIGKGEINIWIDHDAYILDFALDTKNEEYYIKKIRTNVGMPSAGDWKVIYPFG